MKKKFVKPILAVLILLIGFSAVTNPLVMYHLNKADFNESVEDFNNGARVSELDVRGVFAVGYYNGKNPILEFHTGGFGIAPSSAYKGVYYSFNGVPVAFQGTDVELTETPNGWEWSGEGDNGGTTEHIEGNWYYFEAHF